MEKKTKKTLSYFVFLVCFGCQPAKCYLDSESFHLKSEQFVSFFTTLDPKDVRIKGSLCCFRGKRFNLRILVLTILMG